MIRVGIAITFSENEWMGGIHYFRNLLAAVMSLPNTCIKPVVFTGTRGDLQSLSGHPEAEIIPTPLLDRNSPSWILRKIIQKATGRDQLFEAFLRKNKIAVLSHSGWLGTGSGIPAIGWIPDFQHVHLPELFSPEDIQKRNEYFYQMCRKCDLIIVSSENAKNDLFRFAPEYSRKARVLRFAIQSAQKEETSLPKLQERFGFVTSYFHLPNQFWAHKNHRVVLDALRILKARGREMLVIATGETSDYRQPNFYSEIMRYAEDSGVTKSFKVLGLIPHPDLFGLMRNSVAVINPSLFEGWSTTVEESKAMNKLVILSDIPVHREQDPKRCIFFDPNNAAALADAMELAVLEPIIPDDGKIEVQRLAFESYGRNFVELICEAFSARQQFSI